MTFILKEENLTSFFEYLEGKYELFAPVSETQHEAHFEKVAARYVAFNPRLSPQGPKKFIFPPERELLLGPGKKNKALVGLHYSDISGVAILDKVFGYPIIDREYFDVREQFLIVGMDHFTAPKDGYDLYLQVIDDYFLVTVGSPLGLKLARTPLLTKNSKIIEKNLFHSDDILSHPRLSEAVEKSHNSKIWDDLAQRCFGCGICSYVCPVCYCFDVQDSFDLKGNSTRIRCWDSCMLSTFSEIGGGFNFRPELTQRIYNWYYHKFVRMPKEYGKFGCVGCSRCIAYCPARINYLEVLEDVVLEMEGKRGKKPLRVK
ncbi:hypothetical protein COX25_00310 [bacterium (Candidatus Howlettbacteria) CG23_combo_of_CG06-09_8_20_14_all_37_9]|nr:MAG: hypothetical protein COX25_00310 [bacterium (Candidatus Howlettbacteria) CG23_combo_of_CG06-09_8_20_14_all_37_9]